MKKELLAAALEALKEHLKETPGALERIEWLEAKLNEPEITPQSGPPPIIPPNG